MPNIPLIIFIITILTILLFILTSSKSSSKCLTSDWSSSDEGWSDCTPDCSGRQSRPLKKIISGDCSALDLEYKDCICKITLENGYLAEDIDYSYDQVKELMGGQNEIVIPPKLKLQNSLIDNSKYII